MIYRFAQIRVLIFLSLFSVFTSNTLMAQHSVARQWNDELLDAIRNDFARPTVHARNLFHVSAAMYDAWAVYDDQAETYFLGKTVDGFEIPFDGVDQPSNLREAREEAVSFAAYRLLKHRFFYSPDSGQSLLKFDSLMVALEYDTTFVSTDYSSNSPVALGNYIAKKIIEFGLQDGSNEVYDYGNLYYFPTNTPLDPTDAGNASLQDPNRWQPLTLGTFIDQSGHQIPIQTPEFLGAEWGEASPFALSSEDLTLFNRDGYTYHLYHDPGPPPFIDITKADTISGISSPSEEYMWTFLLPAVWSSHLDTKDSVLIDISPASIGNISNLPTTIEDIRAFYKLTEGGDPGSGHEINPATGTAYKPQMVYRGDYARILAEFWADGPDSETPPGHWFTILNYVNDHDLFEKKYRGSGPPVDDLEWDVKAYFSLGGAMHDAAIAAWGVKGRYDYIRPISAIRSMADRGQSSDTSLANYHPGGIPLIDGFIEIVTEEDDSLSGQNNENVGKIKLYTWRGHDYISDPETEAAGVDWILAENWWPYQRPSFVTPPFAGYVSGHSTFSRAAAEVLTLFTGDEFFPGGMGEFFCPKNEFLAFEEGPSTDVILQWATYRDASDQCSLSRIWGGIHPPVDDIPGRLIGIQVGVDAFNFADKYFRGVATSIFEAKNNDGTFVASAYPNPVQHGKMLNIKLDKNSVSTISIYNTLGQMVFKQRLNPSHIKNQTFQLNTSILPTGIYFLKLNGVGDYKTGKLLVIK